MTNKSNIKMRTFKQDKLWRDKAPEMMEAMGSRIHIQPLTDNEYDYQLRLKLGEECAEVVAAKNTKEMVAELADLLEVIDGMCALHNFSKEEVVALQKQKYTERGGFYERKFVTIAEHPDDSFGARYCLADPQKYPEIS